MTTSPVASSGGIVDPDAVHLDSLVRSLDLGQKVALLTGASSFTLLPMESIGLTELRLSDGPTGVRGLRFRGGHSAALLPNATLLAAGWSESAMYQVGRLLAEEALAQDIHVVLGPTINLHRSPLGGRLFEAYSEDPLLSGRLAAAYVRGLQDQRIGACVKHLVANESETDRNTVDCVVDEATLREVYLLPFEIALQDGGSWSVMAAYNDVNGVPATEQDDVVNGILKGEWAFDGVVMSDWYATTSAAPAANAGLDLVMPGPAGPWGAALVAAVESGEVAPSTIDDHVRRLLLLAQRVGALGPPRKQPAGFPAPDSPERREQLTRLAAAGMIVLTNDVSALPLRRHGSVALIGRHAVETVCMGGGAARVNPPYQVSIAEGLVTLLDDRVTITDGVEVRTRAQPARSGFVRDPDTGAPGVHVRLLAADGSVLSERSGADAVTAVGMDDGLGGVVHSAQLRARLASGGGPLEVGVLGVGDWHVTLEGESWHQRLDVPGRGFGQELVFPPTWTTRPASGADAVLTATVALVGADGEVLSGPASIGLVARQAPLTDDVAIAAAVRAAGAAETAVVVVGLTEEQETEAVDKSTLALPGAQDALVTAVAAAAARTVVVVNAATPVLMPWLDQVDAVLWVGLPGQEGGHAVAATLLGKLEPAGRLVTTFPVADGASPAWSVSPVNGELRYTEGRFVGYRGHHAGRAPAPAFWFGHGLGYGSWDYTDARVLPGTELPAVRVTVTNTGTRVSREVVQLYLCPVDTDHPVRLVGWQAVEAEPGRSASVTVTTDARAWRRWDTSAAAWRTLPRQGELLVARGLGDVRARLSLDVR